MTLSDLLSIPTSVIASFGGGTLMLIALSSWLGKVWATRIMEREKATLSSSIERVKADLNLSLEHEKAKLATLQEAHRNELQESSSRRHDALNRKRDVYTELATKMRVFVKASKDPSEIKEDSRAFLAAYDKGYIWASEPVVMAIRDLLIHFEKQAAAAKSSSTSIEELTRMETEAQALYQRSMLEMRRDAGFPDASSEYRIVSFG